MNSCILFEKYAKLPKISWAMMRHPHRYPPRIRREHRRLMGQYRLMGHRRLVEHRRLVHVLRSPFQDRPHPGPTFQSQYISSCGIGPLLQVVHWSFSSTVQCPLIRSTFAETEKMKWFIMWLTLIVDKWDWSRKGDMNAKRKNLPLEVFQTPQLDLVHLVPI